jgi:hypothetical protein
MDIRSDKFCWRCHKESVEARCSVCPRSWHRRCMGGAPPLSVSNWICGECAGILQAENPESRSQAMAQLTVEQLCMMLKHVVERMRDQHGVSPALSTPPSHTHTHTHTHPSLSLSLSLAPPIHPPPTLPSAPSCALLPRTPSVPPDVR